MKHIAWIIIALTLAGCAEVDVGIPDPTTTGQLVVAYDADTQGMALLPGACSETPDYDAQVLQGVEGVEARAYYGLQPGPYCLRWGVLTAPDVFTLAGVIPFDVQAGTLDFVSIVPITTQPVTE